MQSNLDGQVVKQAFVSFNQSMSIGIMTLPKQIKYSVTVWMLTHILSLQMIFFFLNTHKGSQVLHASVADIRSFKNSNLQSWAELNKLNIF